MGTRATALPRLTSRTPCSTFLNFPRPPVIRVSQRSPGKKLALRISIGLSLIFLAVGLFAIDGYSGRSFGVGCLVIGVLSAAHVEVLRMFGKPTFTALRALCGTALGASLLSFELIAREWPELGLPVGDLQLAAGFLYMLGLLGVELRHTPAPPRLDAVVRGLFAFLYVFGPGALAMKLRYGPHGLWLLLYIVAVSKGSDVFAYFVGRFFGKRKLIPHISPGKTRAGGFGALLGGVVISLMFSLCTPVGALLGWKVALAYGTLLAVVTAIGDLAESVLKRATQVKDSGSLLPEFGGLLDVVDCILFTAPVFYFLLKWHKGVAF